MYFSQLRKISKRLRRHMIIFGPISWIFLYLFLMEPLPLGDDSIGIQEQDTNSIQIKQDVQPVLTNMKYQAYSKELVSWRSAAPERSDPASPGHLGEPFKVPPHLAAEAKSRFSKHQLDVLASEMIPANRILRDYRHDNCKLKIQPRLLPTVSVIVVFHNEPKSTLARTVTSVINRSPPEIIKDIILVDDFSSSSQNFNNIRHISNKVKMIRLKRREGLIRARLRGAAEAKGAVLVFFDAHVEVTTGWLEPLLAEVVADRTTIAVPTVSNINNNNFMFQHEHGDRGRSGFDLKLYHSWIGPAPVEDGEITKPYPTPAMIGCAFAVDRLFFWRVGSYDAKMNVWGGENIEQSIRSWLCGGRLLIVPCSIVGHVFRDSSPHSFPGGSNSQLETVSTNTARLGRVWLEHYFNFLQRMTPALRIEEVGQLEDRLQLKQDIKCRNISWYLETVYPDSPLPFSARYVGQINLQTSAQCLSVTGGGKQSPTLEVALCLGLGSKQSWIYKKSGQIQNGNYCIQSNQTKLSIDTCDYSLPNQLFIHDTSSLQLVDVSSGLCVTSQAKQLKKPDTIMGYLKVVAFQATKSESDIELNVCDIYSKRQKWDMNVPLHWQNRR